MATSVEGVLRADGKEQLGRQALSEKLQALAVSIDQAKGEVYDAAERRHKQHDYFLDNVGGIRDEVESLTKRLQTVKSEAVGAVEAWQGARGEGVGVGQQLVLMERAVGVLGTVVKLDRQLCDFEQLLAEGRLVDAATSIVEMGAALDQLRGSNGECHVTIINALKASYREKRSKVRKHLEQQWADSVQFSATSNPPQAVLALAGPAPGHGCDQVLSALGIMDLSRDRVTTLTNQCMANLLAPSLTGPATLNAKVTASGATLTLALPQTTTIVQPRTAYEQVLQIISFVHEHLFGAPKPDTPTAEHFQAFGRSIYQPMCTAIIEHVLGPDTPTNRSELDRYAEVATATAQFETTLKDLGVGDGPGGPLGRYCSNVHVHYFQKRKEALLAQARDRITSRDMSTVEVEAATERGVLSDIARQKAEQGTREGLSEDYDEGVFALPTMQITANTQALVASAYETLESACGADQSQARQLFETTKDTFVMFLSLAPIQRLSAQDSLNPQAAMHLHNDVMYIAHHLLTMGHQHQLRLDGSLPNPFLFVDLVPQFWAKAEEIFLAQMRKQESLLVSCIAQASGFGSTQTPERYPVVEQAVRQAVERLEHLSRVWAILPPELFRRSVGCLVDVVAGQIVDGVLALDDIAAEEAKQLHYLLTLLLIKAPSLFEGPKKQSSSKAHPVDIAQYSSMLSKYEQLVCILDMSMKDIVEKWSQGTLLFTASETRRLIKALFMDTANRQANLALIR